MSTASDAAWLFGALAEAFAPAEALGIADWALKNVVLGPETNSPKTGPLDFGLTPYCLAPLARLSPSDPARTVNVLASAQSGKSGIGQAWTLYSAVENPGPIGIYLPSLDDARKYAEEKISAVIDGSPKLRHRFAAVSTRSNEGSSTLRKRFAGGSLRINTASSPNALQMVSFRDLILEEIAGYETDVGGRGSPIAQARKRQQAWEVRGAKTLMCSAAGVQGACPSSAAHEAGTAHEAYLPCPHCDGFNRWEWEDFNAPKASLGAHLVCRLCGGVVEHRHKRDMVAKIQFIATFEESGAEEKQANPAPPRAFPADELARWAGRAESGRQPSFRWWLYVSPFTTWDLIWADGQDAKKSGLAAEKTFHQQVLARAWDEGRDAPDHVVLHGLREEYDEGEVPAGVYLLTGMADVQGDRLHFAVYGWAPGAEWWLIERDVLMGDPSGDDVWKLLRAVTQRRYRHAEGGEVGIELFGVDSGYKSNQVYQFCARTPNARALDGRPGWSTPYLGKPKRVVAKIDGRRVGATLLHPTGTWSLKSELQYSLRKTIEVGPGVRIGGRGHFHHGVDENHFRELVSETLVEETERGRLTRVWRLRAGFRNEELDCWVGARALAFGLGVGAPKKEFDFEAARAAILAEKQADLFAPQRLKQQRDDDDAQDNPQREPDGEGAEPKAPPPRTRNPWATKHRFVSA